MKRYIALILAIILILAMTACADAGNADRINEILETLQDIRDTVDSIPADAFLPKKPVLDGQPLTFLTTETSFRRQTKPGTLTVGMLSELDSFDPCSSTHAAGLQLIYDPLFSIDSDGKIRGVLAEEWEYRDATHLYIRIREASFSNGDPVTAEDCLWSLRRFAENDGRWHHLFDFLDPENCKTLSDTEFVLAMKEDFGPGLRYLASYFSSVLDKSYVSSDEDMAFNDQPVGSGPYVYVAGEDGSDGTFTLREDYWNAEALPEADTIRLYLYDDPESLLADYESGELDLAFSIDAGIADRLLSGSIDATNYGIVPEHDVFTLILPEYVEAFEDTRVRRAIAQAVNWDSVRESSLGILGTAADSLLPLGVSCKASCGLYTYDPDAAAVLLEEADFEFTQSFSFVVENAETEIRMARAIQRDLQAAGIHVHVGVCSRSEAEDRYNNGESDFLLCSLGVNALDPDHVFDSSAPWSECTGSRISEEPLPTYLTIGRWSTDDAIREESYRNAQSWMFENIRQIPIAEVYGCCFYRPYVEIDASCLSVRTPDLRSVRFP